MPERYTFDSEAILAFFFDEKGADVAEDYLKKVESGIAEGYINIINLTEIYYILCRLSPELAEEKTSSLRLHGLKVVAVEDNGLWREAAHVKANHHLSLADSFAVATAGAFKSKLVIGSDREFSQLNIHFLRIRQ